MLLTFKERKFILRLDNSDQAPTNKNWIKNFANNTWQTYDVNAAVRFKEYADEAAKKFFKRVLLVKRNIPAGGVVVPEGLTLFKYQANEGVPFILSRNRSYLAHDPGLGKTAQFICAVNTKPGPCLIICPAFLKGTWVREITKWSIKDFPHIVVLETKEQMENMSHGSFDFVIVSDAIVSRPWVLEFLGTLQFRFVCIDEAHRFKTPHSQRAVAVFGGKLAREKRPPLVSKGLVYKAEHVVCLSGTPILNRPFELWPVLFALAPETIDFMDQQTFGFKYCDPTENEYGEYLFLGSANEAELHKKLFSRFMHRLEKSTVLPDLPAKVRQVVMLPEGLQQSETHKMDLALQSKINLDDIETASGLGEYATLRHLIGQAKVQFVTDFVTNTLQENPTESIILYAHHRDVIQHLTSNLRDFAPRVIVGGVSAEERQRIQDDFQNKEFRLLIGNISSMNLGLTLTAATRVVFAEYDWTPSANEQAEDRAHRIGQTSSVFVQYLVLPKSLDEIILNALLEKQKRIAKIIGGKK